MRGRKSKQKNRILLIFDFDGTIADTKLLYYTAIYKEVKFFGYSYKDVDRVVDLGLSLKSVLKKLGFSFLTSWFLHKKIMKSVKNNVDKVKKCKDVDSIKLIKADKIIVSNSLKEFIFPILKHLGLTEFKKIYGAEDFSDKSKFIKDYIEKNKLKKEECYYIGDRFADAITARRAGCTSVIVSGKCAWDSRKEILKAKPDFIVKSLAELKKIVD